MALNKFIPPLILLAAGMYFWWSRADSVPSEILTTWRTGTDHRLLTLYKGGSKDAVDGYFYNSKSGWIEGMVRSKYRDSVLTGHWFQANNRDKCSSKMYGTYYWGKFRLDIRSNSFKGKWSYCNNELGGSWNGRHWFTFILKWQGWFLLKGLFFRTLVMSAVAGLRDRRPPLWLHLAME